MSQVTLNTILFMGLSVAIVGLSFVA